MTTAPDRRTWKALIPQGLILLTIVVIGGVAMVLDGGAPGTEDTQRWAAARAADPSVEIDLVLGVYRLRQGKGATAELLGYATLLGTPRAERDVEAVTGAPQPQRCPDAVPAWLPPLPQGAVPRCLTLPTTRGTPSFISFEIAADRIEAEMTAFIDALGRRTAFGAASGTTFHEEGVHWTANQTWNAADGALRVDLTARSNRWIKAPGPSGVVVIRIIDRTARGAPPG